MKYLVVAVKLQSMFTDQESSSLRTVIATCFFKRSYPLAYITAGYPPGEAKEEGQMEV